jgi:hypothetical protein
MTQRKRAGPPPSTAQVFIGGPTPGTQHGLSGVPAYRWDPPGYEGEGSYVWDGTNGSEASHENALIYRYNWEPVERRTVSGYSDTDIAEADSQEPEAESKDPADHD